LQVPLCSAAPIATIDPLREGGIRCDRKMITGELGYHLINSLLITVFACAFVLFRYRTLVLRGMQSGAPALQAVLPVPQPDTTPRKNGAQSDASQLAARIADKARRVALVYVVSAVIVSTVLGVAFLWADQLLQPALLPARLIAVSGGYVTVAVPMIALALAWPARRTLVVALTAVIAGAALTVLVAGLQRLLTGSASNQNLLLNGAGFIEACLLFWATAAVPFAVLGHRRVRGVSPLLFAGIYLFGFAPLLGALATSATFTSQAGTALALGVVSHAGAFVAFNGIFLLLAIPTGWVGWRALHALTRAYRAHLWSDAQLVAAVWWLLTAAIVALDVLSGGVRTGPLLLCAVAAGAFVPIFRLLCGRLIGSGAGDRPRTLLLLRTFGDTGRTQRLMDSVVARWRLLGPVTTIAAPDLTSRTIQAADFLAYATGHLAETFIRSESDLQRRLQSLEMRADIDGRYRINALCCAADTWHAAVVALMERADLVLMDVRGLTVNRLGCAFELQQLANRMPPRRLVFLVDPSTDRNVLSAAFGEREAQVRLVEVQGNRPRDADAIEQQLIAAAA
jgi:hypothetical protein